MKWTILVFRNEMLTSIIIHPVPADFIEDFENQIKTFYKSIQAITKDIKGKAVCNRKRLIIHDSLSFIILKS